MNDQKFRQAYDALIERMPDPPSYEAIASAAPLTSSKRDGWRSKTVLLGVSLVALVAFVGLALLIAPDEGETSIPTGGSVVCEMPPEGELTVPDSDFILTVTPNPVSPGGQAELVIDVAAGAPDNVVDAPSGQLITGVVVEFQCWDGTSWVDTHWLFKDGLGSGPVEMEPDVTISFPAVGLLIDEPHTVLIPNVPPGLYRIEDTVTVRSVDNTVYALVEVADDGSAVTTASPSTSVSPGTTTEDVTGDVGVVVPIDVGPLEPRGGHSVVWTGSEMIVWGGEGDETGSVKYANGAAFNPQTETWRLIADAPLSPRSWHIAAWTGEEMLILGGVSELDGARYSPSADTWTAISDAPIQLNFLPGSPGPASTWTGSQLVVWAVATDEVAAYDPTTDEWTSLPRTGLSVDNGTLRWNGEHVYAFGDHLSSYPSETALLMARLANGAWETLPSTDLSSSDLIVGAQAAFTQWDGRRFLAWSSSTSEALTKAFDPTTNRWDVVSPIPDPPCEGQGEPIQASGRIISFGSCGDTVSIWDPDTESWSQVVATGAPTARRTIWTGEQLINWGDTCCYGTGGEPFRNEAWRLVPW